MTEVYFRHKTSLKILEKERNDMTNCEVILLLILTTLDRRNRNALEFPLQKSKCDT